MRLGVLVSGRGSNLEAVLQAVDAGQLPSIRPVVVISNRPGIPALKVASHFGVASRVLLARDFDDPAARDRGIGQVLTDVGVDLALLAGYDHWLRPPYFAAFEGRTINIHPSLLPRHGGPGMIGAAVHAAVLQAGESETGVTIHDVTADLDAGPILVQQRVAVEAGDTAATLAERVLEVEHRCLVEALWHLSASMTGAPRARIRVRR
ncbi:MAG: phosphoribosylglycinamide formyltransferase [Chloroflexota bacterium]|nr:phosphoribosylglycinamide formyltransferase [Chloroflexota bacterium]